MSFILKSSSIDSDTLEVIHGILHEQIFSGYLTNESIEEYKSQIKLSGPIDYEKFAASLIYLYFKSNYSKTRSALEMSGANILSGRTINVLDLGCGSGASTLALVDWFLSCNTGGKLYLDVVDISGMQLNFNERIMSARNVSAFVEINRCRSDCIEYLQKNLKEYDLVVDGNFICELDKDKRKNVMPLIYKSLKSNGKLLIVEQLDSGVYTDLKEVNCFKLIEDAFLGPLEMSNPISMHFPMIIIPSKSRYHVRYGLYEKNNGKKCF